MDIRTFDKLDNRIPARNDAMSSCSKHLLPSLSFNWDVRTFWTGYDWLKI